MKKRKRKRKVLKDISFNVIINEILPYYEYDSRFMEFNNPEDELMCAPEDNKLLKDVFGYFTTDKFRHIYLLFTSIFICDAWNLTDKSIKCLRNIKDLCLWCGINITDNSIKCLKKLEILQLENCANITDESIKELVNLKKLDVDCYCQISDQLIEELKKRGVWVLLWGV